MRMTAREQSWVAHLGDALFPDGPEAAFQALSPPPRLRRGPALAAALAERLHASPPWAAVSMRFAVVLLWFAPLWHLRRLRTFGGLSLAERVALWEALLAHPVYFVREAVGLLKLFLCLTHLGDAALLGALGAYGLGLQEARP